MSVFIELVTDAFADSFNAQSQDKKQSRRAGTNNARRPLRGLEVKDDTYAIIKLVTSAGQEIPLIDSSSSSGTSTQYTNFILQSVQEARMEKHQIVETFGESYIFFFGESPRFLDVQAVLVDSNDFNWYAEFWENYNTYLRGTKSVELGARTYLFYDDNIVEGYMLNATARKTSEQPLMAQLSFRLFLTNYSNISFVGDPNFPVRGSIVLPEGVSSINDITTDPEKLNAVIGANLQSLGFGGANSLAAALRSSTDPSTLPQGLQEVMLNAAETIFGVNGGDFQRTEPLRGLIADNVDEFTGAAPPYMVFDNDPDFALEDNIAEAEDLSFMVLSALVASGAQAGSHDALMSMGLGPRFGVPGVGIGSGAGIGVNASFGARAGFGVSGNGGLGGGLGFGGAVGAGIGGSAGFGGSLLSNLRGRSLSTAFGSSASGSKVGDLLNQLNAASFKDLVDTTFAQDFGSYQNGVVTGLGIISRRGVGGGISGGIGDSVALGVSFGRTAQQDALRAGLPPPLPNTAGGASVFVGGVPSAFSMTSAAGTLNPAGFNGGIGVFSGSTF